VKICCDQLQIIKIFYIISIIPSKDKRRFGLTPTVKLHQSKAFTAERNSNGEDIADLIIPFATARCLCRWSDHETKPSHCSASQANCGILLHVFFIYIFLPSVAAAAAAAAASVGRWE
jgi:hypothetical protein